MERCFQVHSFGLSLNTCDWSWNWSLDSNDSLLFHGAVCAVYAISVKLLQLWVGSQRKYKAPKWLDSVRWLHNAALSAVSAWMFITLLYLIVADGRLFSWNTMACQMTPMKGLYGFANFVFLVSKLWEWCDTYFLVLTQKPVITLHWFHHMTTFTMAAVTHNFPVGGYTLINCLVHTVMYMHYARPVRWARPFITSSQLLQFVVVISIHTYGYMVPSCYDMKPVMREWWYCEGVVVGYFVMFVLFFVEEYVVKKNKKSEKLKPQ